MEKDINVLVDVDPDEAEKLIGLIEVLIRDWYILREQRQQSLTEIVEMGKTKQKAKQGQARSSTEGGI
jgi:hypothetical protein